MSPDGVVALVTGGGSGLGRATALRLRDSGATVVSFDACEPVEDAEEGVHAFTGDVRDPAAAMAAVALAETLGELRLCVNCAGVFRRGALATAGTPIDLDEIQFVLDVNVVGTFNITRVAAAAMQRLPARDGERGVVVNTASVAAFDGQVGCSAYSASKAAIVGMTLPLARELAASLIRCVAIAPGIFDTAMLGAVSERAMARAAEVVPHPHRLGESTEFAALVVHVIENAMLNGEVIRLDGAVRLPPI